MAKFTGLKISGNNTGATSSDGFDIFVKMTDMVLN